MIHTMSLTSSSGMESILSKPSENEALEIWKKFTEQPWLVALGLAPFVYRRIVRMR